MHSRTSESGPQSCTPRPEWTILLRLPPRMEGSLSQDVPIGATQVTLAQLSERSRDIFRQIVESYLATGEPVGSRNHFPLDHHPAFAGFRPQRDVGPRAARSRLCAAHLGGPSAHRARTAVLRRCADGDRRPRGIRPARDGGEGRRRRQVHGGGAQRSLRHAVRSHPRGRRGPGGEIERAIEAHRVRAARAGARAGRSGRPRTGRSRTASSPFRPACPRRP